MNKKETIQIMALLSAFYGAGKSDPNIMAEGWYLILEPYDFEIAKRAVLNYAKNQTYFSECHKHVFLYLQICF